MVRKILAIGALITATVTISALMSCNNPVSSTTSENPAIPAGVQVVFSSGMNDEDIADTSKWSKDYMINVNDFYPQMRATTEAAHSGKYSVTSDSNRTALVVKLEGILPNLYNNPEINKINKGICGVEFYIMAKAKGGINFTLELGQYAGSSGGLSKSFGIGFDIFDSIKATHYDADGGRTDKMVEPIKLNYWYKCKIEINFNDSTATYYIDGNMVDQGKLPSREMYGIDKMLIFRGPLAQKGDEYPECQEGPKPYYIDDIVLYTR